MEPETGVRSGGEEPVSEIATAGGERVRVSARPDGGREIAWGGAEGRAGGRLQLTEEEARRLAAALGGGVAASTASILDQLSMEWVSADPTTPLPGHSIGELAIRNRTGASILAIVRDDEILPNPGPDERILVGDLLVVVGTPAQVGRFRALASSSE